MVEEVGLGVALGELLVALPHHEGQVPELGGALGDPDLLQRLVERELARRGAEQVLTPEDVRDLHHRVVDGVDQGVQRVAVRAGEGEVGHAARGEGGLAAHHVVPREVVVGHPQSHNGFAPLCGKCGTLLVGQVPVEVVVAEFRVTPGRAVTCLDLLRR